MQQILHESQSCLCCAEQIYRGVKGRFEKAYFIPVSETPDTNSLLRDVWAQLGKDRAHPIKTTDLFEQLSNELKDKSTLLVLDDVWSARVLQTLDFVTVNKKSRLIVTTRNRDVLNDVERRFNKEEVHVEEPPLLNLRNSLKLLWYHAFRGLPPVSDEALPSLLRDEPFGVTHDDDVLRTRDEEFHRAVNTLKPEFGAVIVDMLEECKGLPLALQVLGSSLQGKPLATWQSVITSLRAIVYPGCIESRAPQTAAVAGAAGPAVGLRIVTRPAGPRMLSQPSYDTLPPHLKQCFMDFAAYPEDARVPEDELAALWAATATVPTTLEWGREQLRQLKLRSLVMQDYGGVYMHDILRDLAVFFANASPEHRYLQEGKQVVSTVPNARTTSSSGEHAKDGKHAAKSGVAAISLGQLLQCMQHGLHSKRKVAVNVPRMYAQISVSMWQCVCMQAHSSGRPASTAKD